VEIGSSDESVWDVVGSSMKILCSSKKLFNEAIREFYEVNTV